MLKCYPKSLLSEDVNDNADNIYLATITHLKLTAKQHNLVGAWKVGKWLFQQRLT